jgi:tetratricopeptide (TPR) repeat protein
LQSSPLFAAANLVSLQDAQVITLPLPAADSLALTPVAGGWQVAAVAAAPPVQAPPQTAIATVEFPMQSANQSIIIQDPLTGGDLLVGTVTQAGDAADFAESGPGYAVLPAWLGVVIVPQADNLGLNASLKGFELVSDAANGLPLGAKPPVSTAALPAGTSAGEAGQTIDLPHGETADLWKQLIADQRAAAILPPLGRLGAQITLARDMLALGLGPEAIGVLDTAILENPAAQENGQIAGMRAIAGVISHRSRASDFTAAGLVPGTELSFWHAAAGLDSGQTTQAMPGLLGGLPLFETYPATLRHTIEAPLAEALADNGNLPAAKQLVQSDPGNPMLDLARAKILDRQGNAKAALAAYQKLAGSQDDRVSALAGARAVELRLAAGQLNDAQAADALDAQLFDWRAPEHERHMRMRIAQLRAAAGQWPQAFTMLAAARRLFPAYDAQIDAERAGMFLKMLAGNNLRQLSPIETVAVLQQNEDLIPSGGDAAPVLSLLAQRLDALDLPGAAAPMLNRLIQRLPASAPRASLGASLAQVDLDAGSPVAALSDLSQTQADNLPPDLTAQRNVLAAKAQAAAGNAVAAINTLAPAATSPGSIPGLDAQAQIAEQSGQWPQAEQALGTLVSRSIPPAGPLDSSQENLLLRLATAASHSNDNATLTSLASQYGSRVGADAAGQMFQTLTAPPLTGDQGLNQALHEIAQLQALPNMVNAVAAPPAKAVASGRATPP